MKKTIITFLLALVLPITASAQLESVKELTMKSEYFNHERQVLIYTPVGYQQYDQTYYDVIYVFDAQDRTMFDLVHCLLNIACKPDPDGGRSQSIPPASIACGREVLGWESNIRNDIDETLGNYIKFRALCIYLFDYMHSSVDVEW